MMKNQQEIAAPTAQNGNIAPKKCNTAATNRKNLSPTRKLTYLATMTALSLLLKIISNALSLFVPASMKISLSYLGWYVSAAILGPLGGGIVAAITDVLGQFVFGTPPNPILTLGNFTATFIFGVIFRYLPLKNATLRGILGATAALIVGTLGINSLGLYFMYYNGMNYGVYLVTFRLVQIPMAYLNLVLMLSLLPVCHRLGMIDKEYRK